MLVVALATAGCGLVGGEDEAGGGSELTVSGGEGGGSEVVQSDEDRVVGRVSASAEDRHPQGSLLTVEEVEVRERSIALDISLVNGRTDIIRLNNFRLWLVDDQDNSYEFSPPEQNANLEVAAGAELTGTIVFLGVLDPEATSLTLKSNVNDPLADIDLESRGFDGTTPKFLVEGLPLP